MAHSPSGRYAADHPDAYGDGWATFIVEGGDLAFSVGIYSGLALCALLLLFARRKVYGGELGGPKVPRYLTGAALVGFWGLFVLIYSLKVTLGF